ncbi:unconventional myosin-XVIIIa-like [Bombus vosnesenskii]|uniref:Unconventional myosin-XVIIIa-like n=1 Tax=Bombus vosnesenskii TaxID=207650 RepID=A0A6J3LDD6_9HYME|nr:unconventional myosin-XVIIIa-like [Bombus vosnesenskii]
MCTKNASNVTITFRTPQAPRKHNQDQTRSSSKVKLRELITANDQKLNYDPEHQLADLQVECSDKDRTAQEFEKHIEDMKEEVQKLELQLDELQKKEKHTRTCSNFVCDKDLEKLRTKELRARLASLGLNVTGRKPELRARLQAALEGDDVSSEEESSDESEGEDDKQGAREYRRGSAQAFVRQERCAKSWAKLKRALRNEFENVVSAQQHEDDLEQLVGFKKQLEKKLADAYEEVEEQRQVVGQWKRRVQSLNGEIHDLRLLEEQTARNNLLEKKQRKFDSETQNLMTDLRQEKAQRKRLAREKEIAIAEFTIEQNLSDARLEIELKEERLRTLGQELEELTFGSKTEEEVAQLKNQLEDAECARAVAVKAKQALEQELNETQASLQEALRQRSEAEDRVNVASRERTELLSELEENKEELAEVLKKYRAAVQQVSEERRIVARYVVIGKVDHEMVSSSDSCGQQEDLANITRRKNLAKQQQQDVVDDICKFTEKDSVAEEIIVSVDGKLLASSMYEPSLRKRHDAATTIKDPDKSEMGKQTAERKIEEERRRSSSIEDEQAVVFQEERDQLRTDAKRRIEEIQARDKWTYNKRRKKATAYRTGDLVAIERMQKGPGLKLHPKFLGPYRVIKVLRNDRYIVQREGEHEGPRTTSTAADHMKWWNADDSDVSASSDDEHI